MALAHFRCRLAKIVRATAIALACVNGATPCIYIRGKTPIHAAFSLIVRYNDDTDLAAELVRFNPDPRWRIGSPTLFKLLDQAQKDASKATRLAEQITRRDSELRFAQTKIQALTLELAHLRPIRFGV